MVHTMQSHDASEMGPTVQSVDVENSVSDSSVGTVAYQDVHAPASTNTQFFQMGSSDTDVSDLPDERVDGDGAGDVAARRGPTEIVLLEGLRAPAAAGGAADVRADGDGGDGWGGEEGRTGDGPRVGPERDGGMPLPISVVTSLVSFLGSGIIIPQALVLFRVDLHGSFF